VRDRKEGWGRRLREASRCSGKDGKAVRKERKKNQAWAKNDLLISLRFTLSAYAPPTKKTGRCAKGISDSESDDLWDEQNVDCKDLKSDHKMALRKKGQPWPEGNNVLFAALGRRRPCSIKSLIFSWKESTKKPRGAPTGKKKIRVWSLRQQSFLLNGQRKKGEKTECISGERSFE